MTTMILSGKNQAATFDPATGWQEVDGQAWNEASHELRKDLTEMGVSNLKQLVNHASILPAGPGYIVFMAIS